MKQVSFAVRASPDDFEGVLAALCQEEAPYIETTAVPSLPEPLVEFLKPLQGHDIQVYPDPPPRTLIGPLVFRFRAIAKEWEARRITKPLDLGEAVCFGLLKAEHQPYESEG